MTRTVAELVEDVREGFEEKLGLRARTLDRQIKKAGRLLPRAVRRDAVFLSQCLTVADNPKLSKMYDMNRATAAHETVMTYLDTIDPAEERRAKTLSVVTSIAFALLVTAALVLFVLSQRGFI